MNSGRYSKFIVAANAAIGTGLTSYFGTAKWVPATITAIGAVIVLLVPNVRNTTTTPPQRTPPV